MATRTKKQTQATEVETVETPVAEIEESAMQTETVEQPTIEPTGVVAMRASLKAAGFRRCPAHDRWMNQLPDAARRPVEGQTDPAIRKLEEFTGHISACKACQKVRSAAKRAETQAASGKPATSVARLVALMQKEDAILAKAKALRATMTEDELDQAEALYHEAPTTHE